MTRLWIVRHGNTFAPGEPPRRIGARTDLPLVESGRAQAHALGQWFATENVRFDRVLSGALARTRETAAIIVGDADAIETAAWLTEIDHGADEGRTEAEVEARIGADAIAAWDCDGIVPDGWTVNRSGRVSGWQDLIAAAGRGKDGAWLIVTSNGAARFALAADAALHAESRRLPSLKLRTGAFGRIAVDGPAVRLEAWDRRP